MFISPSRYKTACPAIFTRSPQFLHQSVPPLSDNCRAVIVSLLKRSAQNGISVQCAEPVTGSSGTPVPGAKKRDTKSASSPLAVTMTPRKSVKQRIFSKFGARFFTADSLYTSSSKSRERYVSRILHPIASVWSGMFSIWIGGRDGKSSSYKPS